MQELADLLAREHVQLEFLLFKIVELHHLLRVDETRFLRWSAAELSRAGERVREGEEQRTELLARLCVEAGLARQADLAALTEHAPEPWHTIFGDHSRDLHQLMTEIDANRQAARSLATVSGHSIIEALDGMYRPATFTVPAPRGLPRNMPVVLPDRPF